MYWLCITSYVVVVSRIGLSCLVLPCVAILFPCIGLCCIVLYALVLDDSCFAVPFVRSCLVLSRLVWDWFAIVLSCVVLGLSRNVLFCLCC